MRRVWKQRIAEGGSILEKLMLVRGLAGENDVSRFLDPQYSDCHDPFVLKDMAAATNRIASAIKDNEKITVYADYDADAVTAAAVLLRYFESLGYANVDYYIPDRFSEGYGMNPDAVKIMHERGTALVITVDCGINAFESVNAAKALGLDVIITDHHQLTGGIPNAIAVINPHRPDDEYPFKHLTGVGVAFKLTQALIFKFKNQNSKIKVMEGFEKWLLDLVAIGTVADCQSLLGENRILVKWGMLVMQKSRWIGLKKLMRLAGIDGAEIDSYKIGFIIAPRINAAGRMEHAAAALQLLLTNDETVAEALAQKLEDLNRLRQQQTERILSEAREQVTLISEHKILLAAGEGWHKGIVGLVAGKLTEEFHRPVLVMDKTELEATGSARSVGSFNIIKAISQSKEILTHYGGHPQAAGFTLRSEHIEVFRKNLLDYAETALSDDDLSPVLLYDGEIASSQVTVEFIEFISRFEPTGIGNPKPRFRIDDRGVESVSIVGQNGKHLRLGIAGFGCIGFNLGFWSEKLRAGERIDIICEPQFNEWKGEKKIQLKINDLMPHETSH